MSREPLLEGRALTWHAGGRPILGPLDLELHQGECLVVVGPNGAGKTTLLRLLTGVLEPTSGELAYGGEPYRRLARRALARRIAYVPQIRPARVPFTVEQVVLLGRYPHLSPWQLAPARSDFEAVEEAFRVVGIEHLRHRLMDELSGGERQSATIAAACAQEAEVLVLDEPTTHLDPRHQREVAALTLRLSREGARTVVAATHDLHFASLVADRVLALKAGRALACGAPREVLCPESLGELFEAPFTTVAGAGGPVPMLRIEP